MRTPPRLVPGGRTRPSAGRAVVVAAGLLAWLACVSPTETSLPAFPTLEVATQSLPNGTVGQPYAGSLSASGGNLDYTWQLVDGTLPDGLTLGTQGAITGTPTTPGTSDFIVEVRSGDAQQASAPLSLTVVP